MVPVGVIVRLLEAVKLGVLVMVELCTCRC
jgi:hypothetical protein